MATDQLDIDGLLALTDTHATDYAKAPDDLRIGHMHLRVGDLDTGRPLLWRRHRLRPDPQAQRRRVPLLGALSPSPRRSTSGRAPAPARRDDTATGLAWFSLEIAAEEILQAQTLRLRQASAPAAAIENGIETSDPWGTRVRLIKV